MRWMMLVFGLSGCVVGGGERAWTIDERVGAVDLQLGSGDVTVVSDAEASAVEIAWDGGGIGRDNVSPSVIVEDGVVWVDANGGVMGGGDLTVKTPPGVAVAVAVERGSSSIEFAAPADVWACTAAGDVSIGVPAGAYRFDLQVGAGDLSSQGFVHDEGAEHEISACVGAGAIDVYAR